MSGKEKLCASCGRYAADGAWFEDEDGKWWCHDAVSCTEGAVRVTPQPDPPKERP